MFRNEREIKTLPLGQAILNSLVNAGFEIVGDIHGVQPLDLRKETGLTLDEALQVFQCVRKPTGMPIQPATNLLKRVLSENSVNSDVQQAEQGSESLDNSSHSNTNTTPDIEEPVTMRSLLSKVGRTDSIITFCRDIDKMLGGGVPLGQLTEFVGIPGIGKTQIMEQICIDVQIPVNFGGVGGRALYIDTEGSFHPHRVYSMATAMSEHLRKISNIKTKIKNSSSMSAADIAKATNEAAALRQQRIGIASEVTPEKLMQGIDVCRVHSQTELLAIINTLPSYFANTSSNSGSGSSNVGSDSTVSVTPLRLVVIDSIAFHFRGDLQDYQTRTRLLTGIANKLQDLAYKNNAATVVTNHMTTKIGNITPAAGVSRSHLNFNLPPTYAQITIIPGRHEGNGNSSSKDSVTSRYDVAARTAIVPALGEQWSRALSTRVLLHWSNPALTSVSSNENRMGTSASASAGAGTGLSTIAVRTASLMKSASVPLGTSCFVITSQGVRDISTPRSTDSSTGKRPRAT
jgi:RAD51-like protein 2